MDLAAKVEAVEERARLEDKGKGETVGVETRRDHIVEEFNGIRIAARVNVCSDHDVPKKEVKSP